MTIDFLAARAALAAHSPHALRAVLAPLGADHPEQLDHWVNLLAHWPPNGPDQLVLEPAWRACLDRLARQARGDGPAVMPTQIPAEWNFLADIGGAQSWDFDQWGTRLALDTVHATRRAAIVGTMRNDGIYLLEWLAHYRVLGFEHFFIYTNDNCDGSDALLACLADHQVLTVFENVIDARVPPEVKAFGHALSLLPALRDYEWAAFVDSDEFLVLAPDHHHQIGQFIAALEARYPNKSAGGVLFDWLWYVSDSVFERQPGLLCERFQHARPHWLAKCLVRVRDVLSMRRQHYPELLPGRLTLDSGLNPVDLARIDDRRVAEYAGGTLNHYWPKSFQEFAIKKARGASLGAKQAVYDRPYGKFFEWNGRARPENHRPMPAELIAQVHAEIARLRALPGVAELADRINVAFPVLLERLCPPATLRQHYWNNRRPEGPL